MIPTTAYLSVAPNPIGIGQTASVDFWLDKSPYGDQFQFTVIVTKPNGANETLGPFASSSVGGAYTSFVPDTVGNYTFVMKFPGLTISVVANNPQAMAMFGAYTGDYMEPSTSNTVTLVVQQEPVQQSPATPLPTSYWQYPVYATNREWSTISGNWLGFGVMDFSTSGGYNATGNFNPYTTAPNTPHIMWTTPYALGGQIGGEFEGSGNYIYYNNYLPPTWQPIIINGVIYTNYQTASMGIAGFKAIDLYTGKTLWYHDTTTNYTQNTVETLRCGQTLYYKDGEQFGMNAYLWTQTGTANSVMVGFPSDALKYSMYDANTGEKILDVVDAYPFSSWQGARQGSSFLTEDANGNLIGYYVNSTYAIPGNPYSPVVASSLSMWNSTLCIQTYEALVTQPSVSVRFWAPPEGASIPFSYGIQWSTPIDPSMSLYQLASSNVVICSSDPGYDFQGFPPGVVDAGYNGLTGQLLWGPINRTAETREYLFTGNSGDGIYTSFTRSTDTWTAYSVTTGEEVWTSPRMPCNAWSSYGINCQFAYGNMYTWDYGGYVNCLNATTGKLLWSWNTGSAGLDTPYGSWPFPGPSATIADGKIYLPEGKIMTPPFFEGAQTYCLNATTGEQMWDISGYNCFAAPAISGGYMTMCNAYDNQIYCYGMGPSKTTINVPQVGVTTATPITITGSITDISAGASQQVVTANFPNGLPCVSDASMTQFMEAVYEQQPMPTNMTGVTVTLTETDHNGNAYTIGSTTTDPLTGTWGYNWTPPIPGNYTITATFAGSGAYYGSYATTYVYANAPEATAPTASPVNLASTQSYIMDGVAAIIVVIIVCVAALALLLTRKKP
jgi:outer membrane protein assembly factor BamB